MNNVAIIGNLGADPETMYSSAGEPFCTFSLAFRASGKKTGWIKVITFGKTAEAVEKHLHKGAKIALAGSLDQQKWEDDAGNHKSSFQLIANNITFIKTDGRGFENKEQEDEAF